jgi:hypothetical protein
MNLLRQRQCRRGKVSLYKVETETEINICRKLETKIKIEIKIHRKLDQKFKDRIFVATTVGEKIRSVA